MKAPKFKVGQKVAMARPNLYGETVGVITEIQKCYKSEDSGLVTFESTIKGIRLPYTFENDVLTVHYPEREDDRFIEKAYTSISRFYGYAVTVKTPKMLTIIQERKVKAI